MLVDFLLENRDIFAWSPKDMPGVPRKFTEHKLHVRENAKPVKQPLRQLSEEKRGIVGEDIARLLAAGFIMEVFFYFFLPTHTTREKPIHRILPVARFKIRGCY